MATTPDITRYIDGLRHTVILAKFNYEIWWVYKSEPTRSKYIDCLNDYIGFFNVSIHAHFVALIVALYRAFENKRTTINVPRLMQLLPSHMLSRLPPDFDLRMKKAVDCWKKVSFIRNNCFGHLNKAQEQSEIFLRAGLSPDNLEELIKLTEGLLNDVSTVWDGSVHAFNLNSRDDTLRLLSDLHKA